VAPKTQGTHWPLDLGRPKTYLFEKTSPIAEMGTLKTDLIGPITLNPSMNGPFEPSKINVHRH